MIKLRRMFIQSFVGLPLALVVFHLRLITIWNKSRLNRTGPPTWAAILCHIELALMAHFLVIQLDIATFLMLSVYLDLSHAVSRLKELFRQNVYLNSVRVEEMHLTSEKENSYNLYWATTRTTATTTTTYFLSRQLPIVRAEKCTEWRRRGEKYSKFDIEQLNENILRCILNYRIYVRHILPIRPFYNHCATVTVCLFVVMPLFLIVHAPYWTRERELYHNDWPLLGGHLMAWPSTLASPPLQCKS